MKIYKVVGGTFAVGPGASLLLLAAVAAARVQNLERYDAPKGKTVLVKTRLPIELKVGELVGLDEVPKGLVERLEAVDKGARNSPEAAMLAAAEEIEEAAAAAEADRAQRLQVAADAQAKADAEKAAADV